MNTMKLLGIALLVGGLLGLLYGGFTYTKETHETKIGPIVFGIMCLNMIRRSPDPDALAASTYSFSRSERKVPRTMRAIVGQMKKAKSSATRVGPL